MTLERRVLLLRTTTLHSLLTAFDSLTGLEIGDLEQDFINVPTYICFYII